LPKSSSGDLGDQLEADAPHLAHTLAGAVHELIDRHLAERRRLCRRQIVECHDGIAASKCSDKIRPDPLATAGGHNKRSGTSQRYRSMRSALAENPFMIFRAIEKRPRKRSAERPFRRNLRALCGGRTL
jgi:hypothetical protein